MHLAWAYVERRSTEERSAQIRSYGDLLRRHREEHAEAWLTAALRQPPNLCSRLGSRGASTKRWGHSTSSVRDKHG